MAIVRKGRQSAVRQAVERGPRFRKLIKWRTGSEGRISSLKRDFGWNRSLMDGVDGTRVWCGYAIFANNRLKISGLIAATDRPTVPAGRPATPPRPAGTSPPPRSQPPPALPLSA